ncbi:hypothetical protein D9758_013101 [Tetrapyrgos nigripes]|uniref:Uncharacterized protein n=1 Tax=Tetrapyrgos nigripes TaxID=182062 RepID=A0A8H5CBX7_9AGAR|nr:hypothetical protein D9758_013101 [Tetrapyrgos nigripes]
MTRVCYCQASRFCGLLSSTTIMMQPEYKMDEVVADSEGEDDYLVPPSPQRAEQPVLPASPMPQDTSRISQFTENTSNRDQMSDFTSAAPSVASKARPRPRPNYKTAKPTDIDSSISIEHSGRDNSQDQILNGWNESMILSIADRAKMRSRDAKSGSSRSGSKDVSSDPPAPPNAQPRSKIHNVLDVIELTSGEEDELGMSPPRPKPKLKLKIRRPTSLPQPSLPIPTSSIAPSVLPPSDPPVSSCGIPPIVTLPESYTDSPLSSSPFPSPVQARPKKKKQKQKKPTNEDVDELEADSRSMINGQRVLSPAPPPFFADSSSAAPQHEVIDLSMLPPTALPPSAGDGANSVASTKQTKPKKPRKKKSDDDDDDIDYIERAGTGKEKKKSQGKEGKEKKKVKDKTLPQVSVVIHAPSTTGKSKAKTKDKDKDAQKKKSKESAKKKEEVFKSKEYIDDDGEDVDIQDMQAQLVVGAVPMDLFGDDITGTGYAADPRIAVGVDVSQQDVEVDTQPVTGKRKSPVSNGPGEATQADAGEPKKKKRNTGKGKEVARAGLEGTASTKKAPAKGKGKAKRVVTSEDEDEGADGDFDELNLDEPTSSKSKTPATSASGPSSAAPAHEEVVDDEMQEPEPTNSSGSGSRSKENLTPIDKQTSSVDKPPVAETPAKSGITSLTSRYSIAPRVKSTPMSELIRRVNSLPNSPFHSPAVSGSAKKSALVGTAYSPYLKASKSLLSKIAPLHPNRKDPPPPLPPPPPRKKTKKEIELEEQWEEELVESVGGMTEWLVFSDEQRKEMRRAKKDRELYGYEE